MLLEAIMLAIKEKIGVEAWDAMSEEERSPRARAFLPAGALLWAWDADPDMNELAGEKWLILLPGKWNKHVQYGWRYDPCELVPPGQARPPPRAPIVDPIDEDDSL